MASPEADSESEEGSEGDLSSSRICLDNHSDIPEWTDWILGLQQGRIEKCEEASTIVVSCRRR